MSLYLGAYVLVPSLYRRDSTSIAHRYKHIPSMASNLPVPIAHRGCRTSKQVLSRQDLGSIEQIDWVGSEMQGGSVLGLFLGDIALGLFLGIA